MIWGVYGAGGCGRGLLPLLRNRAVKEGARIVFVDDSVEGEVNNHGVMHWDAFSSDPEARGVCLAIADPATRAKLAMAINASGIELLTVRAPDVIEMDDVEIGPGACLSPGVVLTSNIRIGSAFHANLGCFIEHDVSIGDFVTLAPGVRINGNITLGDRSYVGAGALLRQGIHVGEDAVVGMGAVVLADVAPGSTVVGNPAREIRA